VGASVKETVRVLKFIFQLVVKLDGIEMCQLKLRDDLLEDTAWPVIMQLFDEDENK